MRRRAYGLSTEAGLLTWPCVCRLRLDSGLYVAGGATLAAALGAALDLVAQAEGRRSAW